MAMAASYSNQIIMRHVPKKHNIKTHIHTNLRAIASVSRDDRSVFRPITPKPTSSVPMFALLNRQVNIINIRLTIPESLSSRTCALIKSAIFYG